MGIFIQELRPFINFGQFVGLFPYRIQSVDKFVFSFRHPITIWFVSAFIFQLLPILSTVLLMYSLQQEPQFINSDIPKYLPALGAIWAVSHYFMIFVSRGVTLRYRQLRSATEAIESQFEDEISSFPHCQNSIKKRIISGLFIIITSVLKSYHFQYQID